MAGRKVSARGIFLRVLAFVFVGVPLLALATCTYTSISPHLLIDPLTRSLYYLGERDPKASWRSTNLSLIPEFLPETATFEEAVERLKNAGFREWLTPSTTKFEDGAVGTRYFYSQLGRNQFLAGTLFVSELIVVDGKLKDAYAYTRVFGP